MHPNTQGGGKKSKELFFRANCCAIRLEIRGISLLGPPSRLQFRLIKARNHRIQAFFPVQFKGEEIWREIFLRVSWIRRWIAWETWSLNVSWNPGAWACLSVFALSGSGQFFSWVQNGYYVKVERAARVPSAEGQGPYDPHNQPPTHPKWSVPVRWVRARTDCLTDWLTSHPRHPFLSTHTLIFPLVISIKTVDRSLFGPVQRWEEGKNEFMKKSQKWNTENARVFSQLLGFTSLFWGAEKFKTISNWSRASCVCVGGLNVRERNWIMIDGS